MELTFDEKGFLKPYENIEIEFDDFKRIFLEGIEESETRQKIFENYERFIEDFRNEITTDFVHWVDGSFVTNKMNPKDIDFVSLIDFAIFEKNEELIEAKFRLKGAKANYDSIDAYTVKVYPEDHERFNITQFDLVYWLNWFTETKKNRFKKKFPKGFISIKFSS